MPTPSAGGAANNKLDVEFTTLPAMKLERHQSPPGAPAHEDPLNEGEPPIMQMRHPTPNPSPRPHPNTQM